jgi:hypothetical protein
VDVESDALYPIFAEAVTANYATGFAGMPTLTDLIDATSPIENTYNVRSPSSSPKPGGRAVIAAQDIANDLVAAERERTTIRNSATATPTSISMRPTARSRRSYGQRWTPVSGWSATNSG